MRDTITESKNKNRAIIVIIAFIILIASISLGIYSYTLEQKAVNIYSDIIKVDYTNKEYVATVKYTVNNTDYTKIISTKSSKKITVNDKIKISYNKDNPQELINNKYYPVLSISGFGISLLTLLIFGPRFIKTTKRNKDVRRMKRDNMFITVPISEVIIDTTKRAVGGMHAYKTRSKFLNKGDGKEYVYESDSVYLDLNKIIQETRATKIRIFIDKLNTSNYYVDLESLYPDVPIIDPRIVLGGNKKEATVEKKVDQVENKEEGDTKESQE